MVRSTPDKYRSKTEAVAAADEIDTDTRRGVFIDPNESSTLLKDWVTQWRTAHIVAPSTQAKYDQLLDNHIVPAFGEVSLDRIRRIAVKSWAGELGAGYAPSTVRSIISLLSLVFTAAVEERMLVDLDSGELWIGEQLQRVRRQLLRRRPKTEASEDGLPMPAICIAALQLRKQQQDRDREEHADRWQETGLVFTTRYGTPIEPRNFSRSFDRWVVKLGLRRITVHGTRKTCGTLLAVLDVHPRVAMQILRHSKIAVTMEIYTEATSEATREALRKLGDSLDRGSTPSADG